MPHGHCLLWRPDLLFLHFGGDLLTTLSYFIIPLGLVYFVRKRDDLTFDWIFILFAAFIFFCGVTHLISMINIWHGYYFIEGLAKMSTGIISTITAIMLWKLIPKALLIPSKIMLEQQNIELLNIKNELEETNRTLEQRVLERTCELEKMATLDSLTGVLIRGEVIRYANCELQRQKRHSKIFSLLMIDIDHFKGINDQYGHLNGDKALVNVAQTIFENSREIDIVGRYGGEEFLVVCPETDIDAAFSLAERIRQGVENLTLENIPTISCSIGVAAYAQHDTIESLIDDADAAMYKAKESGRNQVQKAS